jgi:hypothetical protein
LLPFGIVFTFLKKVYKNTGKKSLLGDVHLFKIKGK